MQAIVKISNSKIYVIDLLRSPLREWQIERNGIGSFSCEIVRLPKHAGVPRKLGENVMKYGLVQRRVLNWLVCGFLLTAPIWLTGCANDPEVRVVTKTEIVEVPVEVVKPVPSQLTDPIPYPVGMPENFTVEDVFDLIFTMYDVIDEANADREKVKEITSP